MTSAQIISGSSAPVESRAGNALANSATDRTPRPEMPVLARPVKNAPAARKAHCQGSRFTGRNTASAREARLAQKVESGSGLDGNVRETGGLHGESVSRVAQTVCLPYRRLA